VKVGVAVLAPLRVTLGPAVWVQAKPVTGPVEPLPSRVTTLPWRASWSSPANARTGTGSKAASVTWTGNQAVGIDRRHHPPRGSTNLKIVGIRMVLTARKEPADPDDRDGKKLGLCACWSQ
jgi:hypothetical protein